MCVLLLGILAENRDAIFCTSRIGRHSPGYIHRLDVAGIIYARRTR
jgi:hypothetical protein